MLVLYGIQRNNSSKKELRYLRSPSFATVAL